MIEYAKFHLPPQMTSFIGRADEIVEITQRLNNPLCRLLSLIGPGGIGKTRLAMEVALRKSAAFSDGIIFVPLAPLSSIDNIPMGIAGALNINLDRNTDVASQLLTYLRDRTLLLLLDNFEHLLDGAQFVAEILQTAPSVRILVTSREPLNLQDEWLWNVKGMLFPEDEHSAQIGDYDAVQLFIARAQRVRNDFDLTRESLHVIRICRLVEGMPLAVELAGGWLKTLTCKQIGDEIQRNLDILVSPARDAPTRHRSIRAVFDHSWMLLTEDQQIVFRRLSVFRGGFTLQAAEKVAGGSLWMLSSLVDKSLLHVNSAGRYDIHELLRQYGEEKLRTAGEMDVTHDAHSAYFLDFLTEWLPHIKGRRQQEAIYEIDADFENIRIAWLRGVEKKDVVRLDSALDTLFIYANDMRTQYNFACKQLMKFALDRLDAAENDGIYGVSWRIKTRYVIWLDLPSSNLAQCLEIAKIENDLAEIALCLEYLGWRHYFEGKTTEMLASLHEAATFYRAASDDYSLGRCLFSIGLNSYALGEFDSSMRAAHESYRIRHEINDKIGEAWSLGMLAIIAEDEAEHERGIETSCQIFQQMDAYWGMCIMRHSQSLLSLFRGEFADARFYAEDGLRLGRKYNCEYDAAINFRSLALVACIEGDYERAKHLCHESRVITQDHPNSRKRRIVVEAVADFGLGHYEAARQNNRTAQAGFLRQRDKRQLLLSLPVSVLLAAHEHETLWACELLGLAFNHPVAITGWLDKWDLIAELRSDLERELGTQAFTAAWERGAKMDLEAAVRQILGEEVPPPVNSVSGSLLPDPISERELEVLRLLADGLSNPEIADRLYLSVGTIKVHVRNIFGKLGVGSRTQAVTQAQKLKLL